MDHLINALVTAVAGLLALVTYAHDPRIRSWDGTTLRQEWEGSIYTAISKSSTCSTGAGATVTHPKCELPPIRKRDHSYGCSFGYDSRTLTFSRENQAARGAVAMWREEFFGITSAKAIGCGLFADPPPRVSVGR